MDNSIMMEKACSSITSNVGESSERQATVTFRDEACKVVSVGTTPREEQYVSKPELFSIEKYLERPLKRETFTLNSLKSWIVNKSDPMIQQASLRLRGALGFRFKLRFRLQVIASPFSSGIYRLCWLPADTSLRLGDVSAAGELTMQSQVYGVEINLQDQTEIVLEIPYTHFVDFMPVRLSDWPTSSGGVSAQYGVLYLFPMKVVDPGQGVTAVTATLWQSMHDIELEGMTPYNTEVATVQGLAGLVEKGLSAIADEQDCQGAPTPCAPVDHDGDKTKLGKVVGDTLWWARKAAGVASAFGFSKPLNLNPFSFMRRSSMVHTGIDMPSTAFPLSTNTDATVAPIMGASSDIDEMSLVNFAQREAYYAQFVLSESDPLDSIKFYTHVTPMSGYSDTAALTATKLHLANTNVTGNSLRVTPLFYASQIFGLWRGTIRYRFHASKTKFHAGRVRITYLPTAGTINDSQVIVMDPDTPVDGLSIVWDLRESSEIVFECPYMYNQYFTNMWQVTASLSVAVMEPLVAPDTVSQSITILVSHSCGSDFEWAMPVQGRATGVVFSTQTPPVIPSGTGVAPALGAELIAETQSGLTTQNVRGTQLTVGESIVSIKQLISKPNWSVLSSTSTSLAFTHWWAYCVSKAAITPNVQDTDYPAYFACVFAFARGGTKFMAVPLYENTRIAFRSLYNEKQGPYPVVNDGTAACIVSDKNTALEVIMPFYQTVTKMPTCLNDQLYAALQIGYPTTDTITRTSSCGWNTWNRAWAEFVSLTKLATPTAVDALFSRSAADDAQLFWQLPTPLLLKFNLAVSGRSWPSGASYYGKYVDIATAIGTEA